MTLRTRLFATATACALAFGFNASAHAAGFYIQEQSAAAQGSAFAGAQVNAQDASVMFNNPAAITELSGPTATGNLSLLIPTASVKNEGSTATGPNGGNPFDPTIVPSAYFATPLKNDRYWLGMSITAPFGLSNEYGNDWFGRYDSTKSVLKTYDFSPVLSMKVNNHFSIGGGPDIQYASARLDAAVNPALLLAPGAPDAHSMLEGSSVTLGYNVGALWKIDDANTVGLHYRSAIVQNLNGQVRVTDPSGVLSGTPGGTLQQYDAHAKLKLPDIIELGGSHKVNDKLTVLGSFNWFGWQNFHDITVTQDSTGTVTQSTPEAYKNSFAVALGGDWQQNDRLVYRAGVQFDRTPTTDYARTTRVADGDRYWLSLGAGYKLTKAMSFDVAATHIFVRTGDINRTDAAADVTDAKSKNHIDLLSASVSYKF